MRKYSCEHLGGIELENKSHASMEAWGPSRHPSLISSTAYCSILLYCLGLHWRYLFWRAALRFIAFFPVFCCQGSCRHRVSHRCQRTTISSHLLLPPFPASFKHCGILLNPSSLLSLALRCWANNTSTFSAISCFFSEYLRAWVLGEGKPGVGFLYTFSSL
jgi:hypothetical protein